MAKLFANSEDPESAASDLGLHCLPLPVYGSLDYNGLNPVSCDIEYCLRTCAKEIVRSAEMADNWNAFDRNVLQSYCISRQLGFHHTVISRLIGSTGKPMT